MYEIKYLKYKAKYLALKNMKEKQDGGAIWDVNLGYVYVFATPELLDEIHKIHKKDRNKVEIQGVLDASLTFNDIMGLPNINKAFYVSNKFPEQIRPCETSFTRKTTTYFSRSTLSEPGKNDIKVEGLEPAMSNTIKNMTIADLISNEKSVKQYLLKVMKTLNSKSKCDGCSHIVMFNVQKNENITIEYIYELTNNKNNLVIMQNWKEKGKYKSLATATKEAVSKAATATKEVASRAVSATKKAAIRAVSATKEAASVVAKKVSSAKEAAHEKMCDKYVKQIKKLEAQLKDLRELKKSNNFIK